jgi:hypothetical protein
MKDDTILHQCLSHEEANWVLNDFHNNACVEWLLHPKKHLFLGYLLSSLFPHDVKKGEILLLKPMQQMLL